MNTNLTRSTVDLSVTLPPLCSTSLLASWERRWVQGSGLTVQRLNVSRRMLRKSPDEQSLTKWTGGSKDENNVSHTKSLNENCLTLSSSFAVLADRKCSNGQPKYTLRAHLCSKASTSFRAGQRIMTPSFSRHNQLPIHVLLLVPSISTFMPTLIHIEPTSLDISVLKGRNERKAGADVKALLQACLSRVLSGATH